MLDPESGPPRAAFHPTVDLASGQTVGWELLARSSEVEPREARRSSDGIAEPAAEAVEQDLIALLLATRPVVPAGHFVVLRISACALADSTGQRLLRSAGRLDGVALVLRGPTNREGLMLLEELRERGALVGCDTAAALVHFNALAPDIVSLPEPLVALETPQAAARGVVAIIAAIAATADARALAHGVTSAAEAKAVAELGIALAQGDAFGSPEPYIPSREGKVSSALFGPRRRPRRGRLPQARPSLRAAEPMSAILDACLSDEEHDWIVLVDERMQPVRLVERAALLRGDPFEHRAIAVHPAMSLEDVARRALDRPAGDRSRPLAVCDAAGRYRGLLMIDGMPSAVGA